MNPSNDQFSEAWCFQQVVVCAGRPTGSHTVLLRLNSVQICGGFNLSPGAEGEAELSSGG